LRFPAPGLLVIPQSHKLRMPEVKIAGPLYELELLHENRSIGGENYRNKDESCSLRNLPDPMPTHSVEGKETVSVKCGVSGDVQMLWKESVIPVFEQWF
jgi:hypothetical protein